MGVLALLTNIREIKRAVVADEMGALLESMGADSDSEAVAAVMGFTVSTINQLGEAFGLGAAVRVCFTGANQSCVLTVLDSNLVAAFVDPAVSVSGIEKKLDTALHRAQ